MDFTLVFILLATTICAAINGMFGMVGGSLLLALLIGIDYAPAIAIPIQGMVMFVSHLSTIASLYKNIHFKYVGIFIICSLPTVILAPIVMGNLDRHLAQLIISLVILHVTWVPQRFKLGLENKPAWLSMGIAGFIGGATSLTLGISSTFVSPLYLRKEWDNETILGTKSASMIYLQVLKVLSYSMVGFNAIDHIRLWAPMMVLVVLGNMVGIFILKRVSHKQYHYLYKTTLTLAVLFLWADILFDRYAKI